MKQLHLGRPNPKQYRAMTLKCRHVAYGGARGGGKSWFVRAMAIILAFAFPGIKILITRRTYRELMNNHIEPLLAILNGYAKYNKTDKVFTFKNGSTIWFGYCNNDSDLGQYQGAEYDIWFADEAGQFQEEWIRKINICIRGANNFPKRTYYTLNPGGPSHAYFRRLFVDGCYEDGEEPGDYAFVQALVTDNVDLLEAQPDYKKELERLPPKLRAAWLEGRWDVYEGQFFEDFTPDPPRHICEELGLSAAQLRREQRWCHVIEPFEIPDWWTIYRSYDWGYSRPFSCAWWAVDKEGVLYRILELYGCTSTPNEGLKWDTAKQMAEIAKVEREHPWLKGKDIIGVADPSIWDGSKGISAADQAMQEGVYFRPGVNDRIPGWMQMHYRLAFDENGHAQMYVFSNCKAFIRTIPTLMYDEVRVEDLDTEGEDHVADECRYMCMLRPIKPVKTYKKEPIFADPLNQLRNEDKNQSLYRRL